LDKYSAVKKLLSAGTGREMEQQGVDWTGLQLIGGVEKRHRGYSMSSEPNFQHSDPRMKLSICETKTMNSFVDFFKIL
jgi:hypothetical protein